MCFNWELWASGGHPVVSIVENGGPWGTGWGCFGRGLAPIPARFRSMEDIK